MADIAIADAPGEDRYTIDLDGRRAGFVAYQLGDRQIALLHAEVDPSLRHRGLASQLIEYALQDARARGLVVLPYCPFVKYYIADHRDYLDLVPAGDRARFGL